MSFTFWEFRARAPELSGRERLQLFHELPEDLQREAWDSLAGWADFRAELDFETWCAHGC